MDRHQAFRYRTILSSTDPLVDDHRVHGVRTLPALAFLDLLYRLLGAEGFALDRTELRDVRFAQPVVITEEFDREIEIALEWRDGHYRAGARSRPVHHDWYADDERADWTGHMTAELHLGFAFPAAPLRADELRRTAARSEDAERGYALGRAAGIHRLPFMTCRGTVHHRDGGLLAELALSTEAREGREGFLFHPAMLDALVVQSALLAPSDPAGEQACRALVPVRIAAFHAYAALGADGLADLRPRDTTEDGLPRVDAGLYGPDGRPAARLEGLALRWMHSSELLGRRPAGSPGRRRGPATEPGTAAAVVSRLAPRPVERASRKRQHAGPYPDLGALGVRSTTAVTTEDRVPITDFMYTSSWVPAVASGDAGATTPGPVLILHTPQGRPLAEALAAHHTGEHVVRAELGTYTRRSAEGCWELAASATHGPAALRADFPQPPRTVYFLGGLRPGGLRPGGRDGVAALDQAEETGVRALFRVAKHLAIPLAGTRPLDWKIVTNDVAAVPGSPVISPYAAALDGLARVLENEHRRWSAPVIDLGLGGLLPGPDSRRWRELAALVAAEPAERGARIAHHGGVRHRQWLQPVILPAAGPGVIRTGGTYAIIGGAGGIGLETARSLARDHGARVALIGRSPLDERLRRRIAEADPTGSRLRYFRADGSDVGSLHEALDRIHHTFGRVHGVIHSALSHSGGLIRFQDEAALRDELLAKARVSVAVTEVFRHEPLDFLLFFSSAQSFLGDPGMAGYAAGSTFQDAYAQALDQRLPFPVRVVDWGAWGTVGAVADGPWREKLSRQGFRPIQPREGLETVLRVLAGDRTQVLVMPAEERLLARLGLADSPHRAPEARRRDGWTPVEDCGATGLTGTWLVVLPEGDAEPADSVPGALLRHGADVVPLVLESGTDRAAVARSVGETLGGRGGAVTGVLWCLPPTGQGKGVRVALDALAEAGVRAPLWCVTGSAVSRTEAVRRETEPAVGPTAAGRWGGIVRLPRVLDEPARARLCAVLGVLRDETEPVEAAVRADGGYVRELWTGEAA